MTFGDKFIAVFTFIIITPFFIKGGLFLWKLLREGENETKCPNCGKLWAGQYMRDELIGIFRKRGAYIPPVRLPFRFHMEPSDITMDWYERFKVHYRCKYCSYEWTYLTSRRQ